MYLRGKFRWVMKDWITYDFSDKIKQAWDETCEWQQLQLKTSLRNDSFQRWQMLTCCIAFPNINFFNYTSRYPASRVSFDLPRQIGKRKETLRAASRFFDPPLIRENGWVSPVSCRWNRFLLTRMIIRLFLSLTAIRMHKCRDHANCTRANKLSLGATDWSILNLLNL